MRAWLAKPRPPGTKISAWYRRLAPPDSTRCTSGSLFSMHDLLHALALALAGGRHGAALDGAVGRRHDAAHALDIADAGDRAAAGARSVLVVVHAVAGERHQLEERRAAVEQQGDALARHQLLALGEARARLLRGRLHARLGVAELGDGREHLLAIALVVVAVAVDLAFEDRHGRSAAQHFGRLGEMEAVEGLRAVGPAAAPSSGCRAARRRRCGSRCR